MQEGHESVPELSEISSDNQADNTAHQVLSSPASPTQSQQPMDESLRFDAGVATISINSTNDGLLLGGLRRLKSNNETFQNKVVDRVPVEPKEA